MPIEIINTAEYHIDDAKLCDLIQNWLDQRQLGYTTVEVSLVDKAEIRKLNKQHHGKNRFTDVLSFPQFTRSEINNLKKTDQPTALGSILACYPVAEVEASKYNKTVDEVVWWYCEHSLYHLIGFHHS